MLRPLRRVTETAKRITSEDLHEWLPLRRAARRVTGLEDAFDEVRARLEAAFILHARHLAGRRLASGDFRLRDTAIRTSLAPPWSLPSCRNCHYTDPRFGSRPGLFHISRW